MPTACKPDLDKVHVQAAIFIKVLPIWASPGLACYSPYSCNPEACTLDGLQPNPTSAACAGGHPQRSAADLGEPQAGALQPIGCYFLNATPWMACS